MRLLDLPVPELISSALISQNSWTSANGLDSATALSPLDTVKEAFQFELKFRSSGKVKQRVEFWWPDGSLSNGTVQPEPTGQDGTRSASPADIDRRPRLARRSLSLAHSEGKKFNYSVVASLALTKGVI